MKERVTRLHVLSNVYRQARGLVFGLSLSLLSHFMYARSEGSVETCVCACWSEPSLLTDAISIVYMCQNFFETPAFILHPSVHPCVRNLNVNLSWTFVVHV